VYNLFGGEASYRWNWHPSNFDDPHVVPHDLWVLVCPSLYPEEGFRPREKAPTVLANSCVDYGRKLVGLPPLKRS
jgi:hypothetical protein